jgi:hypothetical protein
MFLAFANLMPAADIVMLHPSDLIALLEFAWDHRLNDPASQTGDPRRRSDLAGMGGTWMGQYLNTPPPAAIAPLVNGMQAIQDRTGGLQWEHLIYAYMVENTRVYDIFRRVLDQMLHGEKFGLAREATQKWLRNTEQLWYSDPAPFYIPAVQSHIRPDLSATRRNAYQRMFGMDLNHGTESGAPYPYQKADAANKDFISMFEEFLREVWIGMANVSNINGPKPTDDAKIANLATRLHDMLRSRRIYGTGSRGEFVWICMMQWFHLTLLSDLPIITDLRAEAASPEERLFKIAQEVTLPANQFAKAYLDISQPISHILIALEMGTYNTVGAVPALYTPGQAVEADLRVIITDYSVISGRDMKAGKVATS